MNHPHTLLLAVLIASTAALSPSISGAQEPPSKTADGLKSRFIDLANRIVIAPSGSPKDVFKFLPRPVLSWSNPARRTSAGALFLWTASGRPQVALCVYPSDEQVIDLEFQSLSDDALSADNDDRLFWEPPPNAIDWNPLDGEQAPARTPFARLRQMRQIARQFSSKLVPPNKNPIELRLLETPVYRYVLPGTGGAASSDGKQLIDGAPLIDGALFTFVQGTDPEVLLMLEAYEADGQAKWRYSLARMSMVPTQVQHNKTLVWETDWAIRRQNTPYFVYKSF